MLRTLDFSPVFLCSYLDVQNRQSASVRLCVFVTDGKTLIDQINSVHMQLFLSAVTVQRVKVLQCYNVT